MTVAELVEKLKAMPQGATVVVPHTVEPCCWHDPEPELEAERQGDPLYKMRDPGYAGTFPGTVVIR